MYRSIYRIYRLKKERGEENTKYYYYEKTQFILVYIKLLLQNVFLQNSLTNTQYTHI